MIKALLSVRFRALLASFTAQSRKKKQKSTGTLVLFGILYLYLAVVIVGVMCLMFSSLAVPYHEQGLDWLYFAMAGLMALGLAVFGSVFSTQSQLYDARDNDLLLSMPIKPGMVLLSRMIPLLCLNLVFAGLVMLPATVMYAILVEFSPLGAVLQVLSLLFITLLTQTIACLLGWGLHLLLGRLNKSFASMLYMVLFLVIYFYVYSQASNILNSIATQGAAIGTALKNWVWPLYAMGQGSLGNVLYFLAFVVICAILFAAVYALLSATFLRSATTRRGSKRRKLELNETRGGTPQSALLNKELRRFLGSPVYLTNMGIGILLTAGLGIAGLIFRSTILSFLQLLGLSEVLGPYLPLIIAAMLCFTASTCCVSAPSVSLEGKNLWIMKALPVRSRQILDAKLRFHCLMATPVTALAGLALGAAYGCGIWGSILCGIVPGLLTVLCGLTGLLCGLRWPRFDWISEAYPCKQSMAVSITMFSIMGVPLVLGIAYFAVLSWLLSPIAFLGVCGAMLAMLCALFYRILVTWGVRKWEEL